MGYLHVCKDCVSTIPIIGRFLVIAKIQKSVNWVIIMILRSTPESEGGIKTSSCRNIWPLEWTKMPLAYHVRSVTWGQFLTEKGETLQSHKQANITNIHQEFSVQETYLISWVLEAECYILTAIHKEHQGVLHHAVVLTKKKEKETGIWCKYTNV